jgi:aminocarboxymuconate-semialdehyde decarboxylase
MPVVAGQVRYSTGTPDEVRSRMNIDVHAHYLPPECADLGPGPGSGPEANERDSMSDLDARVRDMGARSIDVQLLSVAPGLAHPAPEAAQRLNDAAKTAIDRYPGRFAGLATVPLEEPEAAARELERAVKELGFVGLELLTNHKGENLDSPRYAPLFRKMVELNVGALVPPSNVMGRRDRLQAHFMANLIGNPTDTAVAAASLIFGGVLQEMPKLRFVLSHGGGTCPALAGRWEHAWRMGLVEDAAIASPPSEYMKLLYFDSITHSQAMLETLVRTYGHERVMLGSDYPAGMGSFTPAEPVAALPGLTTEQREATYSRNAVRVFGLEGLVRV